MTFKIELVETYGWRTALRALRRPYNKAPKGNDIPDSDDIRLMKQLIERGDDHAKVMRLIGCGFTIQAPRYWWLEFSTYRIGVESVSESTMHRRQSKQFEINDFEDGSVSNADIDYLNAFQAKMISQGWGIEKLKQRLPEGFLQTRDVVMNYQAMRHMVKARQNHKLPHWQAFCNYLIANVPYGELII